MITAAHRIRNTRGITVTLPPSRRDGEAINGDGMGRRFIEASGAAGLGRAAPGHEPRPAGAVPLPSTCRCAWKKEIYVTSLRRV
ncbi:hypothetical protein EVAR_30048_1 [Eumeta japonica]|uniref:Uncharacterized protein n=1 Tax=Eumeta variegata TaxID=151549 RepID=A0A4C1VX55_EUMVA|nr:hypothetical protein EVAR_30048_1 [Eumeta japonica]